MTTVRMFVCVIALLGLGRLSFAEERSNVQQWLDFGDKLYRSEKYDEAIDAYRKIYIKDGGNIRAIKGLAICYKELGDVEKSEKYFKLLQELEPAAPPAPQLIPESRREAQLRRRQEAEASSVPFADKATIDVSPEVGLHDFNSGTFSLESDADSYLKQIKALGYTQNGSKKTSLSPNYFQGGVRIEYIDYTKKPFMSIGAGYRYLGVATTSTEVSGDYPTPFYQYLKVTETQNFSAYMFYGTLGIFHKFGSKNNKRIGLRPEIGHVWGDGTDTFKATGYNGSYFENYANLSAHSETTWYSLAVTFDYQFIENASLGFEGGYKRLRFDTFKVTKIDSNFSSYKVGDTVKDTNRKDYAMDLDGIIATLKISYLWQL